MEAQFVLPNIKVEASNLISILVPNERFGKSLQQNVGVLAFAKILKWRNEKSSNGGTKNPQMAENIFAV